MEPLPVPESEPAAPPLLPLPFEDLETYPFFWPRVWAMFALAFRSPLDFLERVPRSDGLLRPWAFYLLLGAPLMLMVTLILSLVGIAFLIPALSHREIPAFLLGLMGPAGLVLLWVLWILFSCVGMLLGGCILHAFLWMWGGLRPGQGLSQTIRAAAYTRAFMEILGLPFTVLSFIPCLGILFAMASLGLQVAAAVFLGLGLAKIHRTDAWRGVCAIVVTPILLGLILVALVVAIVVAVGVAAAR